MNEVILQTMILPGEVCRDDELFYRANREVKVLNGKLVIPSRTTISTDTYMNCFDAGIWEYYTGIHSAFLKFELTGMATLRLYTWDKEQKEVFAEYKINNKRLNEKKINFKFLQNSKIIFFEFFSETEIQLSKVCYGFDNYWNDMRTIHLSLVICTYKRNKEILKNLDKIRNSMFFDRTSELYGGLSVRVVDNASELEEIDVGAIKLFHNPNTGGSGGFTRGIVESRSDAKEYGITHVILMDDDVEFVKESFYRLYALLSLLKSEYHNDVIAGRMFQMEQKSIQFTASEIWNKGNVLHVDGNQDMRRPENLIDMNKGAGEYTGWWFGCFPMDFVRNHLPLPFFLHCDDVEYGLRHGGQPIVMNGIQVWHESFENRVTPITNYYDMRNPLIVNVLHNNFKDEKEVWRAWKRRFWGCCYRRNLIEMCICVIAMQDYLKGSDYFLHFNQKKKINTAEFKKVKNAVAILWPPISRNYKRKGKQAFLSYKSIGSINL